MEYLSKKENISKKNEIAIFIFSLKDYAPYMFLSHKNGKQSLSTQRHRLAFSMLRLILAKSFLMDQEKITFYRNKWGKVSIHSHKQKMPQFSISYSDQIIAIAVTLKHKIGIDIVNIAKQRNFSLIADNAFHILEAEHIHQKRAFEQAFIFYKYWSLKEAYSKAIGRGLHMPFSQFYFTLKPEPRLYNSKNPSIYFSKWRFKINIVREKYLFTIAVRAKKEEKIHCKIIDLQNLHYFL